MKNGEKKGFDVNDVSAYLEEIEKWRDILQVTMTSALKIEGIKQSEQKELALAVNCIASIDHLAKVISGLPYTHEQAYALSQLLRIMGAAFIAGKYDSECPIAQKVRAMWAARARSAKPRTKHRDQIIEVVARHCAALWDKNPKRAATKKGTAEDILTDVNSDLTMLGIKPLTDESLRKKIHPRNWRPVQSAS
jgi:hypothetical protein